MSITKLQNSSVQSALTSEQYWKEIKVKQEKSGLSRREYCRRHQLNYNQFDYWLRKVKPDTPQQLVPIKLNPLEENREAPASPVLCTLTLGHGRILTVHDERILPLILSTLG